MMLGIAIGVVVGVLIGAGLLLLALVEIDRARL